MTHQSTVITDNTTGNNFSLTSDGIPNETLDLTDSSSLSSHGCILNDIFEETRHLQQLIIPRNYEGNILSSPIFLNSNIALHSSTSTTCSTPYSFASPYLMSPFETSPPTPTIGLSLPSSPSQNKNRQKPLDAFFEGKEYENDFESENDLLAPKGKSLDLQIFEYFNKSRMLSRNKEIENKNVIDCGSAESGSITAVDKSKIIASNIVEYKKGNYGYNIPKGANGYIFERVTGTGDYLILKTDTLKIHTNENIESAGMTIDENDRGSSRKGEKVVDFEEIQDKDERVTANLKLKLKLKKKADIERKEAFKLALMEARSKVSMSAEFTISVIPEHVLKMTSKYMIIVSKFI